MEYKWRIKFFYFNDFEKFIREVEHVQPQVIEKKKVDISEGLVQN